MKNITNNGIITAVHSGLSGDKLIEKAAAMSENVIDFAGLADFEIDAAAPFIWPSWANFKFVRSVAEARGLQHVWSSRDGLAVRLGDPRIDDILEMWKERLSFADHHAYAHDYVLHGRRLAVVTPDMIYDFAVIPKSVGLGLNGNLYDDGDPKNDEPFEPRRYHRGANVIALPWDASPDEMAAHWHTLEVVAGIPTYVEWRHHYGQFHGAAPIVRRHFGREPEALVEVGKKGGGRSEERA